MANLPLLSRTAWRFGWETPRTRICGWLPESFLDSEQVNSRKSPRVAAWLMVQFQIVFWFFMFVFWNVSCVSCKHMSDSESPYHLRRRNNGYQRFGGAMDPWFQLYCQWVQGAPSIVPVLASLSHRAWDWKPVNRKPHFASQDAGGLMWGPHVFDIIL